MRDRSSRRGSSEGVTPSLTLLLGTSATGTAFEQCSDDGGHVHGAGQLRRQHRLHQRRGEHHVHDQPGRADGERDRRSGTYNGAAFAATATVAGASQRRGQPGRSDAEPDLLLGHERHGHGLERRSDDGGTYTVLASFAGSTDYTSGAASTTFTISQAAPSVSVTDTSGTYNGAAFTATDTVAGVGSQSTPAASLEGVTPSLTYYSGTSATGTALSGAPTTVGTYTVLASFAGSTDYTSGTASTTFTISQAVAQR